MPSFLENLPSRGNLIATIPGQSVYKQPQTYIAQHDTSPPEDQIVTTDPENILLRTLKVSQKKETGKAKAADKGKRPASETPHGVPANKKQNKQAVTGVEAGSSQAATSSKHTLQELQGKTNKALMDVLKERGLSTKGKKEELVKRILDAK